MESKINAVAARIFYLRPNKAWDSQTALMQ
jgi:hypothetical protein